MSIRILGPIAAAVTLLVAPATGQAAFSSTDFDGDTVPNASDNCIVVPNPGQAPGATPTDGAACSGARSRASVKALRFAYSKPQIEVIYRALPAGPMPGWGVETWGRVRLPLPGAENKQANMLLNEPVVPNLWQGQVFFTHERGGHMYNRTLHDAVRTFQADIAYGRSLVATGDAIIATYPAEHNPYPVSNIVLECRTVQTKVYYCYAWWFPVAPFVGPKIQLFYVLQDGNPDPATHDDG